MLLLYVCVFITATLAVYSGFVFREERKERVVRRLSLLKDAAAIEETYPPGADKPGSRLSAVVRSIAHAISKRIKRSFRRNMTESKTANLELRLLQAGKPFGMSAVDYRLVQIALWLTLPALFGLYAKLLRYGFGGTVMLALIGGAIAAAAPSYYLSAKARKREKQALKELPDVLDLLTVSLEAGLGFDSALSKLVSKKEGVLSAEFQRCLEEIRLGKTRREALLGLKERLRLEEVRTLISSILQAEKLGIGMVQVLRVQSHEVREQRKQRAEESAMKAPIKMLFPLVLFIFPSLFIVLLGPVLIQFMQAFSK